MEKTSKAILDALATEAKVLYKDIRAFISRRIGDPKPDPIHCSYQIVEIKGNQYAYRSQYNPSTQKTSNIYLGKVAVPKDEYREFKKKEKQFKKLLKAHKHIEYELRKVKDNI